MFDTKKIENIVLVTIDCLRSDIVDTTMPTLHRLADDGVNVSNCISVGSGTPTCMPGIIQSRLPTDDGGEPKVHVLPTYVQTLAETLSGSGFACAGWHSNIYTSEHYGYHRGFGTFRDLGRNREQLVTDTKSNDDEETVIPELTEKMKSFAEYFGMDTAARHAQSVAKGLGLLDDRPHASASVLVDAAVEWMGTDSRGQQFAWLHSMDLHSPYLPPEAYRRQISTAPESTRRMWLLNEKLRGEPESLSPDEIQKLYGLYRASAAYVDDQIERLVATLRRAGIWKETLLVVTADHGEMFNDKQIPDDLALQHPNYLDELVTNVPLVFAGSVTEDMVVDHVASAMDIAPSIASAVGSELPEAWHGYPIMSDSFDEREVVYSVTGRGTRQDHHDGEIPSDTLHVSARTDDYAVLWWSYTEQEPELYRRTVDGEEQIAREKIPDHYDRLLEDIEERFHDISSSYTDSTVFDADDLNDAAVQRLQELGYIE